MAIVRVEGRFELAACRSGVALCERLVGRAQPIDANVVLIVRAQRRLHAVARVGRAHLRVEHRKRLHSERLCGHLPARRLPAVRVSDSWCQREDRDQAEDGESAHRHIPRWETGRVV